jgi:hypothetical protein
MSGPASRIVHIFSRTRGSFPVLWRSTEGRGDPVRPWAELAALDPCPGPLARHARTLAHPCGRPAGPLAVADPGDRCTVGVPGAVGQPSRGRRPGLSSAGCRARRGHVRGGGADACPAPGGGADGGRVPGRRVGGGRPGAGARPARGAALPRAAVAGAQPDRASPRTAAGAAGLPRHGGVGARRGGARGQVGARGGRAQCSLGFGAPGSLRPRDLRGAADDVQRASRRGRRGRAGLRPARRAQPTGR